MLPVKLLLLYAQKLMSYINNYSMPVRALPAKEGNSMKNLAVYFKLACCFIIAMMFVYLLPQRAEAVEVYYLRDGNNRITGSLRYTVAGNNATIINFSDNNTIDLVIPARIEEYTVTGIKTNVFRDCVELKSVSLPGTITKVGENAFMGCNALTRVDLAEGITGIEMRAFASCDSLTSITIPQSMTTLSDYLFSDCSGLTTVNLPSSLTSIGTGTFKNCQGLTNISLPATVKWINSLAFFGCSSLRSIAIPSGITTIYEMTFKNCTSLTNVTLPEGITRIDQIAFQNCSSLQVIHLPDSLRRVGMFLFKDCRALQSIDIPGNLTVLGLGMFENCSSLTSVFIPSSVTGMEGCVFRGCSSLESIAFPDSVNCLEGSNFAGCTSLKRIKFSAGDPSIGSDEFLNCTSLRSITIPEHISRVGDRAFKGCTNLTEVKFLGNAPHPYDFGFNVFDNCAPGFKIQYIFGKTGWSNPYNGYPAERILELDTDIPEVSTPVNVNPDALQNINEAITGNILALKAQGGVSFVKLDWNKIASDTEITGYNVYKATSPGTQPEQPTASVGANLFTYIDPEVKNGVTYYYMVKAVYAGNTTGTASNEVSVSPKRAAAGTIELSINNPVMSGNGVKKQIDQGYSTAPVIKDGRTFLPIRAVIDEMGGNIKWDANERKVTTLFDGRTVELWIGSNKVRVNGTEKSSDAAPYISSTGRTMLPLRFVGESLGCDVIWNAAAQSVTITYDTAAEKVPEASAPEVNAPAAPTASLPAGVPASLPTPTISNLELLKYDDGVPYFQLQLTVPESVLKLDKERPADGWVNLEISGKIDNEEWGSTGGGGGHLEVFSDEERAVPGKTNGYYVTFDLEDEGGLGETSIKSRNYSYKMRFSYSYSYGDGPGESAEVFSPWSNQVSGQSETYYYSETEEE